MYVTKSCLFHLHKNTQDHKKKQENKIALRNSKHSTKNDIKNVYKWKTSDSGDQSDWKIPIKIKCLIAPIFLHKITSLNGHESLHKQFSGHKYNFLIHETKQQKKINIIYLAVNIELRSHC